MRCFRSFYKELISDKYSVVLLLDEKYFSDIMLKIFFRDLYNYDFYNDDEGMKLFN